jgi:flagellar assembly protein FliH
MATILRAADAQSSPQVASFNLDDVAAEAEQCLAQARTDAAEIVAKAESQAADIRRQAAEAGCKAAMQEFEKMVAEQVAPAIEALRNTVAELHHEKQAWVSHWESGAVHLAAAIAARVIRREVRQQPEITLTLVREALDLAAGSPNVRLHLNPEDFKALGVQVRTLIDAMSALGDAEVTPDASIGQGGCRVETRFGTIDQQIETQLQRIEEELAA